MKDNFAEILKAARKAKRWTQTEAAEAIPISLRQYQKYEAGLLMPPWDVLSVIQQKLGVNITNLQGESKGHRDTITISQRHLLI
jgi:transcriptional regulator with XRE-family HTH domain